MRSSTGLLWRETSKNNKTKQNKQTTQILWKWSWKQRAKKETSIQENLGRSDKKKKKKVRVCGIWAQTTASFSPPTSETWRLHSWQLQPRTQGYFSSKLPAGGLSSQEEQELSISHSACSFLLLRLCLGQVWLGSGGSFLIIKPHLCNRGSILDVACWEY